MFWPADPVRWVSPEFFTWRVHVVKQLSSRILAICLSLTLLASAIVGAMSVSVLHAKADLPDDEGYLDDLFDEIRVFCPSASLSTFDSIHQQLSDNFDNWLIMIEHKLGSNDWTVVSYSPDMSNLFFYTFFNGEYLFRPRYTTDYYNYNFHSRYGFMIKNGNFYNEPYNTGLGNTNFTSGVLSAADYWQWWYCCPSDVTDDRYECWTNQSLRILVQNGNWSDNNDYIAYITPNLYNGSYTPPITEYHWFKFQLGDRWFITTTDQSYVNNMLQVVETRYVWKLNIMFQDGSFDEWYIESDMMVRLSYAENFIIQQLENVSPLGVFAYDITDWVNDTSYVNATSVFYQVFETPGGYFEWLYIAYSDDVVSFVLSPQEEEQIQNNAWTTINNYVINYPSVTVAPEQLAEQLFGVSAYTGFMGDIRIPYSLGLKFGLFGQDVNLCDAYFHYWLYQSGLGADENSLLNFDLFNACVIAAPQVNRNVYVAYWDTDDPNTIDYSYVGLMDTQDLLDTFDLLLVAPAGSDWLKEVDGSFPTFTGSSAAYTNLNQESPLTPRGAEGIYPIYVIVSHKAITKSQLYVFCDGFNKLYNLATQFCNKRDLWDSSFFEWSMSIFWELQSIDGHLSSIELTLKNWDLTTKLNSVIDSLNRIADNTDELQEPMWYESLWNWVWQFTPSDSAFLTGLNAIDDGFDNIPLLPVPTNYPNYPLLPTFTPTPVPDPGGE